MISFIGLKITFLSLPYLIMNSNLIIFTQLKFRMIFQALKSGMLINYQSEQKVCMLQYNQSLLALRQFLEQCIIINYFNGFSEVVIGCTDHFEITIQIVKIPGNQSFKGYFHLCS
jgi:hypothetical protein